MMVKMLSLIPPPPPYEEQNEKRVVLRLWRRQPHFVPRGRWLWEVKKSIEAGGRGVRKVDKGLSTVRIRPS